MTYYSELPFEDFVRRLFEIGFTDLPEPPACANVLGYLRAHPFIRSFGPPDSLRSAIKWLNTSGESIDDYSITVGDWSADGSSREWGELIDGHGRSYRFGLLQPTEELLDALASGAEGFTNWFTNRIALIFKIKHGKTVGQGVVTVGGKTHTGTDWVN
jgi:hypothetical protein